MRKSLLSIPILLLVAMQWSYAQPLRKWMESADSAYAQRDFYSAFKYYEVALKYKGVDSTDVLFKYAESARQFNAFLYAEEGYQQVINRGGAKVYPRTLSYYWLGYVEQILDKCGEAKQHYQQFLDAYTNTSSPEGAYRALAEKGVKDCDYAASRPTGAYIGKLEHMDTSKINSPYSDFGAVLIGDTLYYSSLQFRNKKDDHRPWREVSKILYSIKGEKGQLLPDSFNTNTKNIHAAHTAFNADRSRMYYNICEYKENTSDVRCELYFRERTGKNWSNPKRLSINVTDSTNTQPSIAKDLQTGRELLFFASNRKGGTGGLDIWYGNINADGDVTQAKLVPEINTVGNEATPYFHEATQTLYFSSTGLQSLGGYDIYQVVKVGNDWNSLTHLDKPINSTYDDLFYAPIPDGNKAYFSSNRLGSLFIDEDKEACCLDIYSVELKLQVNLQVATLDCATNTSLNNTTVRLYELRGNDTTLLRTLVNPNSNQFNFAIQYGKKYVITAQREGFGIKSDTVDLTGANAARPSPIKVDICLESGTIVFIAKTFKNIDSLALIGCRVELLEITADGEITVSTKDNPTANDFSFPLNSGKKYLVRITRDGYFPVTDTLDLTKPPLQNTPVIERDYYLSQLLEILTFDDQTKQPLTGTTVELVQIGGRTPRVIGRRTNNLRNDFLFPIDLGLKYLVTVSKPGYITEIDTLEFNETSSSGKVTVSIYLKRSEASIVLYFDNDEPNPNTTLRISNKDYGQTYEDYYDKKEQFKSGFTAGSKLSDEQRFLVNENYENFFERDVKGGYTELVNFTEKLQERMIAGDSVQITLRGFSSPRAGSDYNLRLSQRRISSVRNFFVRFETGFFLPYIRSGKLRFVEQAKGEETPERQKISATLTDAKGSIFSVFASTARRVEVIEIGN